MTTELYEANGSKYILYYVDDDFNVNAYFFLKEPFSYVNKTKFKTSSDSITIVEAVNRLGVSVLNIVKLTNFPEAKEIIAKCEATLRKIDESAAEEVTAKILYITKTSDGYTIYDNNRLENPVPCASADILLQKLSKLSLVSDGIMFNYNKY